MAAKRPLLPSTRRSGAFIPAQKAAERRDDNPPKSDLSRDVEPDSVGKHNELVILLNKRSISACFPRKTGHKTCESEVPGVASSFLLNFRHLAPDFPCIDS